MRGTGEECGVLTTAPRGLPCAAPRTRVPPRCGRRGNRAPGASHGASGGSGACAAPQGRGTLRGTGPHHLNPSKQRIAEASRTSVMTKQFTILYENRRSCGEIRSLTLQVVVAKDVESARTILVMSDMEYDWNEDELTSNVWEERSVIAIFEGVVSSVWGLKVRS